MKQITPKIIQNFTLEERNLFKAGLLSEEKNWTTLAKEYAIDLFLNDKKSEMIKLAKEIIEEEREEMFTGIFPVKAKVDSKEE